MPPQSQKTSEPKSNPGGNVARIVLVDDHPMVRERLAEVIERQLDLAVCGEAEGIHDALKVIAATSPNLAIIDLSLKDGFGLDLVHEVRERHPKVAVLVLTMFESALYAERSLRAGALGYLTKREATTKILEAIRTVLRGEPYLSAGLAVRVAAEMSGQRLSPTTIPLSALSDRELEVFRLIGEGRGNREIAAQLHVDVRTVETYRNRIKEKLGLKSSGDVLKHAIEWKQGGEGI